MTGKAPTSSYSKIGLHDIRIHTSLQQRTQVVFVCFALGFSGKPLSTTVHSSFFMVWADHYSWEHMANNVIFLNNLQRSFVFFFNKTVLTCQFLSCFQDFLTIKGSIEQIFPEVLMCLLMAAFCQRVSFKKSQFPRPEKSPFFSEEAPFDMLMIKRAALAQCLSGRMGFELKTRTHVASAHYHREDIGVKRWPLFSWSQSSVRI